MPVHRVSHEEAEARVAEIEQTEEVVSVASDDTGLYVATKPKAHRRATGGKETRG